MPKETRYLLIGLLSGLLSAAVILIVATPTRQTPVTLLPTPERSKLTVHITGAVNNPGVYELPAGSRAEAAVQAAGGWKSNADETAVNLAAFLEDGQLISIPYIGEKLPTPRPEKNSTPEKAGGLIDINTASMELLDELPGIGPQKAEEIVSYRQKHGAFDTIEEILNVPGIGPGIFEDIRNRITISSPADEEGQTDEPQRIDQ